MLGCGAMATVWLTNNPRLNREAMLSCLDADAGSVARAP